MEHEPTPTSLAELHEQAQRRIGMGVFRHCGQPYHPVQRRYQSVASAPHSPAGQRVAGELRDILAADDETLKRMVMQSATDISCNGPAQRQHAAAARMDTSATASLESTRPKITPAELAQQFRARGFVIAAAGDALHVSPAEKLTAGDRQVLHANKPGILAALTASVAVI